MASSEQTDLYGLPGHIDGILLCPSKFHLVRAAKAMIPREWTPMREAVSVLLWFSQGFKVRVWVHMVLSLSSALHHCAGRIFTCVKLWNSMGEDLYQIILSSLLNCWRNLSGKPWTIRGSGKLHMMCGTGWTPYRLQVSSNMMSVIQE